MKQLTLDWMLARIPSFDPDIPYQQMASGKTAYIEGGDVTSRATALLRPDWGHSASHYLIEIAYGPVLLNGWLTFNNSVTIDHMPLNIIGGASTLPGMVYIGEPLDTWSSVQRFAELQGIEQKPFSYPPKWDTAATWLLSCRRKA